MGTAINWTPDQRAAYEELSAAQDCPDHGIREGDFVQFIGNFGDVWLEVTRAQPTWRWVNYISYDKYVTERRERFEPVYEIRRVMKRDQVDEDFFKCGLVHTLEGKWDYGRFRAWPTKRN